MARKLHGVGDRMQEQAGFDFGTATKVTHKFHTLARKHRYTWRMIYGEQPPPRNYIKPR